METLYQTVSQSGISIPFPVIQQYGLKQGMGIRIELLKDSIRIMPAQVDAEDVENRALQYLLQHVGDAVVIGSAERTGSGAWMVPVFVGATGESLGELYFNSAGKLIPGVSTSAEALRGDGSDAA